MSGITSRDNEAARAKALVDAGASIEEACRVAGLSRQTYTSRFGNPSSTRKHDLAARALALVKNGMTISAACEVVGISRPTYLAHCGVGTSTPAALLAAAMAQIGAVDSTAAEITTSKPNANEARSQA